jgi:hypothetical protein
MPPERIEILLPPGATKPTGSWSLGVRAGDFVFVAGMRGIDPATDVLVEGAEARGRHCGRSHSNAASGCRLQGIAMLRGAQQQRHGIRSDSAADESRDHLAAFNGCRSKQISATPRGHRRSAKH